MTDDKERFHIRPLVHHIGLITPTKAFGNVTGIEVEACNGWIVSQEDFKPHYLDEIQLNEPFDMNACCGKCFINKHISTSMRIVLLTLFNLNSIIIIIINTSS